MPVLSARRACIVFLLLLQMPLLSAQVLAQPVIPNYWDEKERLPRPDLSSVERLRFLTTIDFPPFNFIDAEGRLAGFHVDLAGAICEQLDLVERCQIQALPWDELDEAMETSQGEALIAGTAINAETRDRYVFSRPYLRFPARFVASRSSTLAEPMYEAVDGRRIGVLAGSRHEAMLRAYFTAARPVTFTRSDWMFEALQGGNIDAIFDDGMRLSFWLGGTASKSCCQFVGGPYLAPEFLGSGLAIAVRKDQAMLVEGFDYALREINVKGIFAELYLKYFPISFY